MFVFRDKSESQRIVSKVVKNLGPEDAEYKNTDEYLRHLQALYLGAVISLTRFPVYIPIRRFPSHLPPLYPRVQDEEDPLAAAPE